MVEARIKLEHTNIPHNKNLLAIRIYRTDRKVRQVPKEMDHSKTKLVHCLKNT